MRVFVKSIRYYYWLVGGFIKKYAKTITIVFVCAFFLLFFFRSYADNVAGFLNFNKRSLGLVIQGDQSKIPLEILQLVSTPIVSYDQQGQLVPELATKWRVTKGARQFTFVFPENIRWQDGTPFTVGDIDVNALNVSQAQVTIVDQHNIRFTLRDALVNFPSLLTIPLLKDQFVGVGGGYKVSAIRYESGEIKNIALIPLESGLPFLRYRFYSSYDDMLLGYKLGEIDRFLTTDRDVVKQLRSWRNTQLTEEIDYSKMVTLFLNTQKEPFDNKNLRQAIAQLIDYTAFVEDGVRAYSPILPLSWAYNNEVKVYNFEPEISKGLVEKNNALGKEITLYSSYELNRIAERVTQNLRTAGFKPTLRYTNYIPNDYDLFLTIWEPNIDPDQYVFWHQTQRLANLSNFKNLKADKFLEDGRREVSKSKRKEAYLKFQELITEEVPAVFLYFPKHYTVSRK